MEETKHAELKPCPMCDSDRVKIDNKLPDKWVDCLDCETEAPYHTWQRERSHDRRREQPDQDYEAQVTECIAEAIDKMSVEELEAMDREIMESRPTYVDLYKQIADLKAKLAEYAEIEKEVNDAIDDRESMLEQLETYKKAVAPSLPPDFDPETMEWRKDRMSEDHEFWTGKSWCSSQDDCSLGRCHWVRLTTKQPEPSEYLSKDEITDEIAKLRPRCEVRDSENKQWIPGVTLYGVLQTGESRFMVDHPDFFGFYDQCRIRRADVEAKEAE